KRAVLMCADSVISRELIEQILAEEEGIESPVDIHKEEKRKGISIVAPGVAGSPGTQGVYGIRPYARVRNDEVEEIMTALQVNHGNKTRAAISLGLTPRQLRYRMQKLSIEY
ncbi:MAG: helix-turn-helix domain-containing protein, partial [Acidiferrobacterales bacterium]|nr:helix-turn-helix domain-containing protein [Acidiferrobacterales bacterium]